MEVKVLTKYKGGNFMSNINEMTREQMQEKIVALEKEIAMLKGEKPKDMRSIAGAITNQKELDFIFPYFRKPNWERMTTYTSNGFVHIRKMAMSAAMPVNDKNKFTEVKVKEMSEDEFDIAVACADELVSVIAKYKKQYLEKIGRHDIIDAFNM